LNNSAPPASGTAGPNAAMGPAFGARVELQNPAAQPGLAATGAGAAAAAADETNSLQLVCRAVSLKLTVDPSQNNKDIAYAVRDEIAASPMVNPDAKATQLVGEISPDDANGTFTFTVSVTPAKPLTF